LNTKRSRNLPIPSSLTDSELERRFLPIARRAGLPKPTTGARVNGYKAEADTLDAVLAIRDR